MNYYSNRWWYLFLSWLIRTTINYYIKNKNNKIIVSSFLIYEDGNHVSYRFNNYFKFKIIKLIYFLLTGKLKLNDMSLTLSGRIIPKLDLEKINENKYEWLSSLIIYKKQSYFDATHLDVDGKVIMKMYFLHIHWC